MSIVVFIEIEYETNFNVTGPNKHKFKKTASN